MHNQGIGGRPLQQAVGSSAQGVRAHRVGSRKIRFRRSPVGVLAPERGRVGVAGEAVIQGGLLPARRMHHHPVADLPSLFVLVEALIHEISQILTADRVSMAQRALDAGHRVGSARVIHRRVAKEGDEIARCYVAQTAHRRTRRLVDNLVHLVVLKPARQADVRGARRSGRAVGTFGKRPLAGGHHRAGGNQRAAGPQRIARSDSQDGLRHGLVRWCVVSDQLLATSRRIRLAISEQRLDPTVALAHIRELTNHWSPSDCVILLRALDPEDSLGGKAVSISVHHDLLRRVISLKVALLFLTGDFATAGDQASRYLARYHVDEMGGTIRKLKLRLLWKERSQWPVHWIKKMGLRT